MTSARKMAAFMLFSVFAAGCKQKAPVIVPVTVQAPPLPAKPIAQVASLPPVPQPETPKVGPPGSDQPPPPPPEKPKRTPRHKAKPATPTTTLPSDQPAKEAPKETPAQATAPTQQALAGEPAVSSPIGQLSTTGSASGTPSRRDILDSIDATEKSLKDISRTLTAQEQETAAQIHTFLTKARQALNQDDLDGANTLSTKAKVLLEELTKS